MDFNLSKILEYVRNIVIFLSTITLLLHLYNFYLTGRFNTFGVISNVTMIVAMVICNQLIKKKNSVK